MPIKAPWLVLLLLLAWLLPAQAERDIVYAARYYLPPGSHGTSHFHLYRINPDGSGKTQLTFGDTDESAPRWSPDGRWVAFIRLTPAPDGKDGATRYGGALCLLPGGGGRVRRLIKFGLDDWYNWGPPRWSPDSRRIAIDHQQELKAGTAFGVSLIDIRTSRLNHLPGYSRFSWSPDGRRALMRSGQGWLVRETNLVKGMEDVTWVAPDTLVGLSRDAQTSLASVCILDVDGHETRRIVPRFPAEYAGTGDDDPLGRSAYLQVIPGGTQTLVYALNNHNSTVGTDYLFFSIGMGDASLSYLTEGQFLAWSPDGAFFCTAPGRDTTVYEKRPYALASDSGPTVGYRTVWSAPLFARAVAGGPMRQLTPRLSWVVGADWRRGGHNVAER